MYIETEADPAGTQRPAASPTTLRRFGNVHHPCMRASPQCHELSLQPTHAVVPKFLHELCILVAAGIDRHVLLIRKLARHHAHGGADRPRSSDLKPASPLPLVSQRPMQTVRQQPASLATGRD
jgi:hypothetical protein